MKTIDDLSNSKKDELICKRYKRESDRSIFRERFIDGLSYEEICSRHYKDWMWIPERVKRRVKQFLCHKFVKFCEYVEKELTNAKSIN